MDEWNAWRTLHKRELADERGHKNDKREVSEVKEEIEVWVDEVIEQIEEVLE